MKEVATIAVVLFGALTLLINNDIELIIVALLCLAVIHFLIGRDPRRALCYSGALWLWLGGALQGFYYGFIEPEGIRSLPMGEYLWSASVLTLLTAVLVATGAAFVPVGRESAQRQAAHLREAINALNARGLLAAFVLLFFINLPSIRSQAFSLPGVAQLLLVLFNFKWFFFFLLAAAVFAQPRHSRYLVMAIGLEIVSGMTGFWAGFKDFLYVFVIALLLFPQRLSTSRIFAVASLAVFMIYLGLAWTAIKPDYRAHVSQGQGQVVAVDLGSRLLYLQKALGGLSIEDLSDASEQLVRRVGYVEIFAEVLNNIPNYRPYGGGELLGMSLQHVFMPRMFFPEKPAIDDSQITQAYTGRYVSGVESATSINIGYPGESYADFGVPGIIFMALVVGFYFQAMTLWLMRNAPDPLIGMALAVMAFALQVGGTPSMPKLFGGAITAGIVAIIVARAFPRGILRWIYQKNKEI